MCTTTANIPLGFTHEVYPAGTHMCLIYSDEAERRKIIGKYLESGFASGERVAYFVDEASPSDIYDWLDEMGVNIPSPDREIRFSIDDALKTYCPKNRFVPDEMLETLRQFYRQSTQDGFRQCRVSGEMTWALRGIPGSERLMEYEALVNMVLITHPLTAVCQYDSNRFDGATLLQCLEVHPFMIVRGQILRNPYYKEPEEFMQSLPRIG